MKYLITGISGFVAGHYLEYLFRKNPSAEVIGIDEEAPDFYFLKKDVRKKIKVYHRSLLDEAWVQGIVKEAAPDYIVHLASQSSVAYSWKNPVESFRNNTNIFLNLIEAVRRASLDARVLSVGSSETYGAVDRKNIPLTEENPLNPVSPYAIARVSQEEFSAVYAKAYGIKIVSTRSFNQLGPRQRDIFVISSFAKQVAEAKKGKRDKIKTGDLKIVRDFIDVRDVVRAYDLLLQKGKVGEIYNVCSGEGHALGDVLNMLIGIAGVKVPLEVDPELLRLRENPVLIGSPAKLEKTISFKREYNLSASLESILKYWEEKA